MLGSPCSPCCACQPCPYCAPPCLTVTFSGFSHGTGNCGECDFLDDTTFELSRPEATPASISLTISDPTGSGATLSPAIKCGADKSCTVTGITVNSGGGGYTNPTLVSTATTGTQCRPVSATITLKTTEPTGQLVVTASQGGGAAFFASSTKWSPITLESGTKAFTIGQLGSVFGGVGYKAGATATLVSNEKYVANVEPATVTIDAIDRFVPYPVTAAIQSENGVTLTPWGDPYNPVVVTLAGDTDESGLQYWYISSVYIDETSLARGSGYEVGDAFLFSFPGNTTVQTMPAASITAVTETGSITTINLAEPGRFYATTGRPTAISLVSGGKYYKDGVIDKVTVADGGQYWSQYSCAYASDEVCVVCPGTDDTLKAYIALGEESHSFTLTRKDYYDFGGGPRVNETTILQATRSALDDEGNPIPCDKLTFEPEHFSPQYSCVTNGTVTVVEGACGDSSRSACQMPEQITMSLSGMGRLFVWSSRNSGVPGMQGCPADSPAHPGYETFCGLCDGAPDASIRQVGTLAGIAGYVGSLVIQDFSVVLDLQPVCGSWTYTGLAPVPPSEAAFSGQSGAGVACNGELGVPVSATISPVDISTSVVIDAPNWGGYAATAEAAVSGGSVSAITVTNGGEGYAREVFERVEPEITVTLSGGGGSGAVLSATLTQSGSGEQAFWYVSAVTVTNGGTGYSGQESVVFTPGAGDTTDAPASAFVVVGRVAPAISAAASPGSGATLAVTLGEGVDWFTGQAYWYVESVAVTNGGTGYVDGDAVDFTVTDGVQSWAAYATIATGRTQPDVTANVAVAGGVGAVLTPTLSANGNAWTVSGLTITAAGSGYSQWDSIAFATADTIEADGFAYISSVDGNGAITGVVIGYGGSYYRSTGVIQSVTVNYGGSYYRSTGVVEAITLVEGGVYYRLQSTNTAEVQAPSVRISSRTGFGATATANVNGTLGSPTFGQITSVTVNAGGQQYVASGFGWIAEIGIGGLSMSASGWFLHTQDRLFPADAAAPENPDHCQFGFGVGGQPIYPRVSMQPCPTELLNKTYPMFWQIPDPFGQRLPEGFADYCVIPTPGPGSSDILRVSGFSGDITVTLATGGGEEE